ncbi:PP2C family protein-serine/threonine phosphatase [Streptomyces sp. NPDC003996]
MADSLRLLQRKWIWWLPLALAGVDIAVDLAWLSHEPISFLLIGVPPLAAATRTPRFVALITVICLLLQVVMGRLGGVIGERHYVAVYLATMVIGVTSVVLARQRILAETHLIRANSVAEAMQKTLLRPIPSAVGPLRAAGFYQAGEGGAQVGGDLYDLVRTPFGVRVILGDVRGKGLGAVETVSSVLGCFRVAAYEWADLAHLAERIELGITRAMQGVADDAELFVTAVLLEFPESVSRAPEVRVVNRGHPPPLVVGCPDGPYWLSTAPAPPLGLGHLFPGHAQVTSHPLTAIEVLVVYTDGVTEARDSSGAFYPLRDRLADHFDGQVTNPAVIASFVQHDTERWCSGSPDDRALLAIALADEHQ